MLAIQWIVAAATAMFVATVGYFQWRTAEQKAVLDLFERRYSIYEVVRNAVGQIVNSSAGFDQHKEVEFVKVMERAYFFFGEDVKSYLDRLWQDILEVRTADEELKGEQDAEARRKIGEHRRTALDRIEDFYKTGQPLFGKYMRFSQPVPSGGWPWLKSKLSGG